MDAAQIRCREVRKQGSIAKYAALDLGRDQGSGRGDVTATFFRVTPDGQWESFTFIPDTIHNRLQLLQRNVELAEWRDGVWHAVGKDSVEAFLAPALLPDPVLPAGESVQADKGQPEKVVVNSLSDFLQLKKEVQLELLASDDFGSTALNEILASTDPRLSKKVREAAMAKAEKLLAVEA